jgi:predicted site-specific integrase-resolvase
MEQTTSNTPQLVNEIQAGRILAVSVAALQRWRREGRGPRFARVEGCIRYDLRAIERFLADNSSKGTGTRALASGEVEALP